MPRAFRFGTPARHHTRFTTSWTACLCSRCADGASTRALPTPSAAGRERPELIAARARVRRLVRALRTGVSQRATPADTQGVFKPRRSWQTVLRGIQGYVQQPAPIAAPAPDFGPCFR